MMSSTGPTRAPHLPQVAEAAWHGYLGDSVKAVAPCTEADPAARQAYEERARRSTPPSR